MADRETRDFRPARHLSAQLDRRKFLFLSGGVVAATSLTACMGGSTEPGKSSGPVGNPARGGNFRLGVTGGGTGDILDAGNAFTTPDLARRLTLWEKLLTRDDNYELQNELAESLEADNPLQYTIRLRQGVEFHNGKTMNADDLIYTLQRIADEKNGLPGFTQIASMDIANIKKMDDYTVRLPMKEADSTLPDKFANDRFQIVPVGYKKYAGDIASQIGTGPYKLKSFTPGQESVHERNENYWRGDGSPWFDQVTITNFSEPTAQVNALLAGQIDAMTSVPSSQVSVLEAQGKKILSSTNGLWLPLCMRVDVAPFDDVRVRQAFRLIIDREAALKQVVAGRGTIGNDLYALNDPNYDDSLPQRAQDIAKAKELLKEAGQENLSVDLYTTNGAAGMVDLATVFAEHAKEAGVTVKVINSPDFYGDGYTKYAFSGDYWLPNNYMIQVSSGSLPGSPYNETHWPPTTGVGSDFQDLYDKALATTDSSVQADLLKKMQEIEYEAGGYIIPFFPDVLDGYAANVQGLKPSKLENGLMNFGHGFRDIWFSK